MKSIVVFYSLEGNCKLIRTAMAKVLGAEVLELKLAKPIPTKGPLKFILGGKSALTKATPSLDAVLPSLSDYDLIVVGSPIWAGTFAPAIRTFSSQARLQNCKMAFFTCNGGGSSENCFSHMKQLFEGNEFLSEIEFVSPASKDSESCIKKAESWAASL